MMPHEPKKITEMYAWVIEEPDGGEGLPAMSLVIAGDPYFTPLCGADRERVEALRSRALEVAHRAKMPLKLVRFHAMEVLERHG